MRRIFLSCVVVFSLGGSGATMAQTIDQATDQTINPERLDELSRAQQDAQKQEEALAENEAAIAASIDSIRRESQTISRDISEYEFTQGVLDKRLGALELQAAALKGKIISDQSAIAGLLAALQRISYQPPSAFYVAPSDAMDAVLAAKLMQDLSAQLSSRADDVSQKLEALETLEIDIRADRTAMAKNAALLSAKLGELDGKMKEKAELKASISSDRSRIEAKVQALKAESDTLRDLIRRFENSATAIQPRVKPPRSSAAPSQPPNVRIKPKPGRTARPMPDLPLETQRFSDAKGQIRAPVQGRLGKTFSTSHQGLTVKTRHKAQVLAPFTGRVEFAGPFKNYDKVVIINVGQNYFILLTGLGETYVEAGEMITMNEPLGLMPAQSQSTPELYVEIRKDGKPVDPAAWFGTAFTRQG